MTHSSSDATQHALRSARILVLFAVVLALLMTLTHQFTADVIQKHDREERIEIIRDLVPVSPNDYAIHTMLLPPIAAFGHIHPIQAFRISPPNQSHQTLGLLIPITAPDGYAGPITLLLAVNKQQIIWGIRVLTQHETPGLGDYVATRRPFNRHPYSWDEQWRSLEPVDETTWKLKKQGGYFDAVAGASISPRAIIQAVHRAMIYIHTHPHLFQITS